MSRPEPFRDLDWEPKRAREIGERALDIWEELLENIRGLPVARAETATEVRAAVAREIGDEPMPLDELTAYMRAVVLNHSMYPGHPGFMAYISGAGTIPGVAADVLAAAVNQNLGGWRLSPAATEIELALMRWFAGQFGLPATAGGQICSGGAMANFIALKAARDAKATWKVRSEGVHAGPRMTLYASEEIHSVSERAVDMLGLGEASLRHLPVDDSYMLRVDALRASIEQDRADGFLPIAVIASAGTVSTGAIDALDAVADICDEFGLWFHVDGAYGGPAVLAPDLKPLLKGIERADSIAFDPHKWLYTPHSGGCVLVRDVQHLADAFGVHASYVHQDLERTGRGIDFHMFGPQFSRGFSAFKVWISLLAHGRDAYARRISHDAALARYLDEQARARPEFESSAPVVLSIACFRYVPPDLSPGNDEYLDALNERIMTEIQLDGRTYCSNAVLRGRFVLRACIVNFRTEADDVDTLLNVAAELGARLDEEMRPATLRAT